MVFVELLCWVNVKWSQGCLVFMVSTAKAFVVSSGAKAVLLLNEWWVEPRLFYCWVNGVWNRGSCTVTKWMSSGAKAPVLSLSEWSKGCCIIEWMTSGERLLSLSKWSGSRNISVVQRQTCHWKVLRVSPGRRIFFSRGSFLCQLLNISVFVAPPPHKDPSHSAKSVGGR